MSFIKSLLEFYTLRLPYHPGKWRVVEALIKAGGIEIEDANTTEVVTRGGLRWRLGSQCQVQRRLRYHGEFDRNDLRELRARLPENPVFLDIGACFGYYALKIRQLCGPEAQVHAFEPFPVNHALLEEQRRLNGMADIRIHQIALSNEEGSVAFETPPASNGGVGHIAGAGAARANVVNVQCTTLDQFVARENLTRIDGIKLDVEGAELRVIEGGAESIRKFHPIILMELNPPCLERLGTSAAELLKRLQELGYSFFRATRSEFQPFSGLNPGESYTNIFCIPNRSERISA